MSSLLIRKKTWFNVLFNFNFPHFSPTCTLKSRIFYNMATCPIEGLEHFKSTTIHKWKFLEIVTKSNS